MPAEETSRPTAPGPRVVGTQTVSRAFAVLALFRDRGSDLGVGQVASELGLNLSTAHRLVRALVAEGYLAQNDTTERYYLGTAALLLGQVAHRNFGLDIVYPVLQDLAARTGESINLGVLADRVAVVVERIESDQPLRFTQPPGTRVVLHASSMGKALLAFNDALRQRVLDATTLDQLTPRTMSTVAMLRAELDATRERGWSVDDEESTLGVRCVGAPVHDASGHARAAIAVQAPAVRMPDERFTELGPQVVRAAEEISSLLPSGHSF